MIKQILITHNISDIIPQAAAYLTSRKDVLFAYLFGSLALENLKPLSDIDIAVYLKKRKLSEKRLEIIGDLADILKKDCLFHDGFHTRHGSFLLWQYGRLSGNIRLLINALIFLKRLTARWIRHTACSR
jgi:predicted nucleotidyltransferase